MKNAFRYLTLILCLVLIGQVKAQAVEPVLLLEKPINEKSVNPSFVNGKIIISSKSEVSTQTQAGKELFKLRLKDNQETVASENGEYFGITTYSTKGSSGFLGAEKFALYSAQGKILWQIENPKSSAFFIANNGKLVVGVSSFEEKKESDLIFYNENGDSIFTAKVNFFQGLSFSPNGGTVFVQSGTDGLLVFDQKGTLKRNYKTCQSQDPDFGQFSASPDGEYIAYVSDGKLDFYHQEKLIAVAKGENILARGIALSPDNSYVSVIDKENLYLFDFESGDLLWQYRSDQPELSFISVDLTKNGEMIVVGIDFDKGRNVPPQERHTQGYVYLFDQKGELTWQKELSYTLWNAFVPQVKFSLDGSLFSVKTRETIYLFEIK